MKKVTVTFDTSTSTWNVMHGNECVFYGNAFEVDIWLDNSNEYEED